MINVICINNEHYPVSLELNKEYEAKEQGDFYLIMNNDLEYEKFLKILFKIKE
jgi:hypothetical protein